MGITLPQIQGLNEKNLLDGINLFRRKNAEETAKHNYSTADKYKLMETRLTEAKKKLANCISGLSQTVPGETVTFMDKYFAGTTDTSKFTLAYIANKISVDGHTLDDLDSAKIPDAKMDVSKISVRRNIFDIGSDFAKDTVNGKVRAPKLTKFIAGYGIAELATSFVTGKLAKAGMMSEATTLLGLAKTGITMLADKLPALWHAAVPILGSNVPGFVFAGAAVALLTIPTIANKIKKACGKVKKHFGVQAEIDKPMLEQLAKNRADGFYP